MTTKQQVANALTDLLQPQDQAPFWAVDNLSNATVFVPVPNQVDITVPPHGSANVPTSMLKNGGLRRLVKQAWLAEPREVEEPLPELGPGEPIPAEYTADLDARDLAMARNAALEPDTEVSQMFLHRYDDVSVQTIGRKYSAKKHGTNRAELLFLKHAYPVALQACLWFNDNEGGRLSKAQKRHIEERATVINDLMMRAHPFI
jgi:hypothetical protein